MAKYDDETQHYARALYLRQYSIPDIEQKTGIPRRTLYHWCDRGEWTTFLRHESVEEALQRRLILLAEKDNKQPQDLNEMDRLIKQFQQLSRVRSQQINNDKLKTMAPDETTVPAASTSHRGQPNNKKRRKKNDVGHLTHKDFKALHAALFPYQRELYQHRQLKDRMLIKSRQIGLTWYFAQEAFEDAVLTGDNQIFLSATRAQAEEFRRYVVDIALEQFGLQLSGNPLRLQTANGTATLYFLANSARSAQGYHGHVYMDEIFHTIKFNELYKVATGMASHKKWRTTLFSTPSYVNHEAYDLWTGERFLKRFKRKAPPAFPDRTALKKGVTCPDGIWRRIITLDDAEKAGCHLFDKKALKLKYSPDEFKNLYQCEFVDDTLSVFNLEALEQCRVRPDTWKDIQPKNERPINNTPVWCGYDPSRHRDDASFVVVVPPLTPEGKHRVIERHKWFNKAYTWQGEQIRQLCQRYNVQHLGIDVTGPGLGVIDVVKDFYPHYTPLHYSTELKSRLVLKAKTIIESGRLEYPADWTDVSHAFLTIRQTLTKNGSMTYSAGRTPTTGHADIAWAIMHALDNEPLNPTSTNKSRVVIF